MARTDSDQHTIASLSLTTAEVLRCLRGSSHCAHLGSNAVCGCIVTHPTACAVSPHRSEKFVRKKAVDDGTGSWAHDKFGVEEPDDDDFLSRVGEVRFYPTYALVGALRPATDLQRCPLRLRKVVEPYRGRSVQRNARCARFQEQRGAVRVCDGADRRRRPSKLVMCVNASEHRRKSFSCFRSITPQSWMGILAQTLNVHPLVVLNSMAVW